MRINSTGVFNKVIKPVLGNKKLYNFTKKMAEKENFYSRVTLGIIIFKHGIEAIIHARASYKNDKVPEEQRKFLAIQDAVNYTLAIVLMATLGMFLGTTGKKYLTEQNKTVVNFLKKLAPEVAKEVKMGIGIALTLMGPILSHRIITPLLSMPLSEFFKNKFYPTLNTPPVNQKPYLNACQQWLQQINSNKLNTVA